MGNDDWPFCQDSPWSVGSSELFEIWGYYIVDGKPPTTGLGSSPWNDNREKLSGGLCRLNSGFGKMYSAGNVK